MPYGAGRASVVNAVVFRCARLEPARQLQLHNRAIEAQQFLAVCIRTGIQTKALLNK
jgi:hypothetical protein